VALEHQAVKELISGPLMSDAAAAIMLDRLEEVAQQIGRQRFHEVVLKIIDTCERRPTVATYRKMAGLNGRLEPQQEAFSRAWELVTLVVLRHVKFDGNGYAGLQPWLSSNEDGGSSEQPVPDIPPGIRAAVVALGGWGGLRESYNTTYWGAKLQQFREIYRGEESRTPATCTDEAKNRP
jgi:hypothetical protein